ncbi:RAMP superfamily CRISPR-associated protein [Spirulina subsalsa]|uniref:RAMP superfamily CRISPR-associated protein n=1 Tax=Spirulina subsalsa TaxID=54311 RepID=UPI00031275D7|nr:RAMP superfamily CRISPR-associated protein [Spirulina subsalsa]
MSIKVPEQFIITIEMTSDWHVGDGSGRGEIDSVVQRDQDNLPYIPGKTLIGILRDSCEQVALALDNNSGKKWQNWINFLLGDQPALADGTIEAEPRPSLVFIGSAYLDKTLRDALNSKPKLKSAIAFIKPGVAIDPITGSVIPKCLRFEEVVRRGATLTSEHCTLNFSGYPNLTEDEKKTAFAILIAGAELVERLGGKRRRGYGNCKITIDEHSDYYLKWLQENYLAIGEPPQWENPVIPNNSNQSISGHSTWYSVPLTITPEAPIIIPKRTVGNVIECLDYIPGRYFLGYLHQKFGQYLNVTQAIAMNHLIVTNGTIAINHAPSRPTPFCLFTEKLNGDIKTGKGVYNRLEEPETEKVQLKGERGGYIGMLQPGDTQFPEYKTVKLQLNTHNTIRDEVQRPTSDVGGVYSYQAISPGTTFKAELRLPQTIKKHLDEKLPNWWKELEGHLRIGQSKKDQYGLIKIKTEEPKKKTYPFKSDLEKLYIWFLSDVLLRDEKLNSTTDPDIFRQELAKELGVTLEEREDDDLLSLMMRSRRTAAWQVRWGLPRPTLVGWQAGSCVVYQVTLGTIKPEKLAELEAKGIGARRAKGYGQICFNDPLLTQNLCKYRQSNSQSDNAPKSENSATSTNSQSFIRANDLSFEYARTIEIAAWREAIENKAVEIAANEENRERILGLRILGDESHPSMSQLGNLRSNLARLQQVGDRENITRWITALQNVPNRREKWDKTANGLKKIGELLTDVHKIWQVLDLPYLDLNMTQEGWNTLQKILWAEAVRTLISFIIRAHKRDLEKRQKETA